MLLNLISSGHLDHWWQYVVLATCFLVQVAGVAGLAVIYVTRPARRMRNGR